MSEETLKDDRSTAEPMAGTPAPAKTLTPAARRALQEAEERRAAHDARFKALAATQEINGRGGLDPVRYDDWEVKGIASDFS